jgi:hypothetical protein
MEQWSNRCASILQVLSLFAIRPSGKAILFIHGFSGDPIKTWSDFHVLFASSLLREFLDRLFQQSGKFVNPNLPSDARLAFYPDFLSSDCALISRSKNKNKHSRMAAGT